MSFYHREYRSFMPAMNSAILRAATITRTRATMISAGYPGGLRRGIKASRISRRNLSRSGWSTASFIRSRSCGVRITGDTVCRIYPGTIRRPGTQIRARKAARMRSCTMVLTQKRAMDQRTILFMCAITRTGSAIHLPFRSFLPICDGLPCSRRMKRALRKRGKDLCDGLRQML